MPGIAPVMMSSRLGLVAEVMATESPSHERPMVIHRTWAVTASVAAWFGTNSVAVAISSSPRPFALSTDPGQRITHQLVHDPPATKRRLHHHHPGRLGPHLADRRRLLTPAHTAQRPERRLHPVRR